MIALLPGRADRFELRDNGLGAGGIFGESKSFAPGEFEEFVIAQRLGHGKCGVAVLAGAEKFAGAALLQVALGDLETIRRGNHRFNSVARVAGDGFRSYQDAVRFLSAAPDPASKLVKLRKTETIKPSVAQGTTNANIERKPIQRAR